MSHRSSDSALRAVTFDFGNTLVRETDDTAAPAARLRHAAAWLAKRGAGTSADALREAFASAERARADVWTSEQRHVSACEVLDGVLRRLNLAGAPEDAGPLLELLENPLPGGRMIAVDGAREALDDLRARGLRLGIVSNLAWGPARVMRPQLESAGLADLFEPEAVVFSDEVGFMKPHPAPFEAALRALGASPSRAAHVGDLKLTDVAGARALGIRTVRFRGVTDDTSHAPEADAVVDRYEELPAALGL